MTAAAEPDPRIARSKDVILRGALEELAEVGYGAFTIESVAARAGVGKSTIYRHWKGKLPLIADALESLNVQPAPTVVAPSARERVVQLVQHVAAAMAGSIFSACLPALVDAAERDAEVRAFHHGYARLRRRTLVAAIRDGVAAGEFAPDVDADLAAGALVGPIFYGRLVSGEGFAPERVPALVELVLRRSDRAS